MSKRGDKEFLLDIISVAFFLCSTLQHLSFVSSA